MIAAHLLERDTIKWAPVNRSQSRDHKKNNI